MKTARLGTPLGALTEAALVYVVLVLAFRPIALALGGGGVGAALTQFTVFAFLPTVWVLSSKRRPDDFGLGFANGRSSFRIAFRGYAVVGPACMVFPLMAWLGTSPKQWSGSILASVVFAIALPLVAMTTSNLPLSVKLPSNTRPTWIAILGVALAAGTSAFVAESMPLLSRVLYFGVVVGFSEEIAFRGFFQSTLNRAFGRPWQWRGVSFGLGLPIAALLFGLAHSIVGSGFDLGSALFTTVLGLTFGWIREKTGSVTAAAILHGLADLPMAFFGRP